MNIEKIKKRIAKCVVRGGTDLNLSSCELNDIPAFVFEQIDVEKIEHLELHDNQLQNLPESIARFSNLKNLDVSENQFAEFPAIIFQLKNLQTLYIYSNQIASVPPEIHQLANLRDLFLGDNKLQTLPAEIGKLAKLTSLNIVHNDNFGKLPAEMKFLTLLESLDLDPKNIENNTAVLELLPKNITVLTGSKTARGF